MQRLAGSPALRTACACCCCCCCRMCLHPGITQLPGTARQASACCVRRAAPGSASNARDSPARHARDSPTQNHQQLLSHHHHQAASSSCLVPLQLLPPCPELTEGRDHISPALRSPWRGLARCCSCSCCSTWDAGGLTALGGHCLQARGNNRCQMALLPKPSRCLAECGAGRRRDRCCRCPRNSGRLQLGATGRPGLGHPPRPH